MTNATPATPFVFAAEMVPIARRAAGDEAALRGKKWRFLPMMFGSWVEMTDKPQAGRA